MNRRRARARAVEDALPDVVDLLVVAIAGGSHPVVALAELAPLAPVAVRGVLTDLARQVEHGERSSDVLAMLVQHGGPAFAPLVDTLVAADRYGLPITDVLRRLADDARAARRRRAEAAARELPVRLAAPLVLCTLPSFVLLAVAPLVLAALSSLQW